jgi:hypothetical protein
VGAENIRLLVFSSYIGYRIVLKKKELLISDMNFCYRCEMEDILLEMDRILRPEGNVIFRDDVDVLVKIKKITDRLNWDSRIVDHEDGPHQREKLLFAVKSYWTAPADHQKESTTSS